MCFPRCYKSYLNNTILGMEQLSYKSKGWIDILQQVFEGPGNMRVIAANVLITVRKIVLFWAESVTIIRKLVSLTVCIIYRCEEHLMRCSSSKVLFFEISISTNKEQFNQQIVERHLLMILKNGQNVSYKAKPNYLLFIKLCTE